MAEQLTELEFLIDDCVGGEALSPANVDLPTLRAFLEEIETLIKGDLPDSGLADSRVSVEDGSLKIVARVPHRMASDLRADLELLNKQEDLDAIQPRRAQIIEQWQSRSRRNPARSYSVGLRGKRSLRISGESRFTHHGESAWVAVEKYVSGRVVDLGGKQEPNVHVVLADTGASLKIGATEQQLGSEKENQLYKEVTLRVHGEQHLRTKELRNLRLIEFLPQSTDADEKALTALWEKGKKAWKNVKSAGIWVEELRGNR